MTQNADQLETYAHARQQLEDVASNPSLLNLLKTHRQQDELARALSARDVRLAVLPSITFEPLLPALGSRGLHAGMKVDVWIAPFDQIVPTLLQPNGALEQFKPDVILIALRVRDQIPQLYDGIPVDQAKATFEAADRWLSELHGALHRFTAEHKTPILLQGIAAPTFFADGPVDEHRADGQTSLFRHIQSGLNEICNAFDSVYPVDFNRFATRLGTTQLIDERMDAFGRLPIHANHYWDYAGLVVRHIRPFVGLTKKVIVLDADNTLWGGIVGDDGADGIQIGQDYPGNAFQSFQRRLLALRDRGVVLCVASKNEPGAVEAVLDKHPDMILRREHFSAMAVNWNPKPDNVRQIADTLNLGLDSFIFIDDSEVECSMMRTSLPQVTTILLPKEPAQYAKVIEELDYFDQFAVSDEDRKRAELYRTESQRRELKDTAMDMESFYRNLQMRLTIGIDDLAGATRAAQMTNRTNQFNMMTVRCSEADIRSLMEASDKQVLTARLHDRFGDNGMIGLAVVQTEDHRWTIEQFLMSCRVLGRTVESNFIRWIVNRARDAGASELIGLHRPTPKNGPFAKFYSENGFEGVNESDDVNTWRMSLDVDGSQTDDWIEIEVATGGTQSE